MSHCQHACLFKMRFVEDPAVRSSRALLVHQDNPVMVATQNCDAPYEFHLRLRCLPSAGKLQMQKKSCQIGSAKAAPSSQQYVKEVLECMGGQESFAIWVIQPMA